MYYTERHIVWFSRVRFERVCPPLTPPLFPVDTCTLQATSPTCENGSPSPRVAFGRQDVDPRTHFPAVGEDSIATDHSSTTSSEGYSTSTFVAETVASSGLAEFSDSVSLGDETWTDSAGGTYGDASTASTCPWDRRREVASEKAALVAVEQADDEDVWFPVDATALYDMQPDISHRANPALVEDARMFANRLTRLAEGQV